MSAEDSLSDMEWAADCLLYWGLVLDGRFGHWCPCWDGTPIDDTCEEFRTCTCGRREEEFHDE